jgi:hypothetical protein
MSESGLHKETGIASRTMLEPSLAVSPLEVQEGVQLLKG